MDLHLIEMVLALDSHQVHGIVIFKTVGLIEQLKLLGSFVLYIF